MEIVTKFASVSKNFHTLYGGVDIPNGAHTHFGAHCIYFTAHMVIACIDCLSYVAMDS